MLLFRYYVILHVADSCWGDLGIQAEQHFMYSTVHSRELKTFRNKVRSHRVSGLIDIT